MQDNWKDEVLKLQELADKQINMLNKVRKDAAMDNTCTVFRSMMNNTISKKDYDASIALTVALLETDLSKVEF